MARIGFDEIVVGATSDSILSTKSDVSLNNWLLTFSILFLDLSYENTSFITLLNPSRLGMRIKLVTKKMRDLTYPGKILTHTGIPTK